MSFWKSFFGAMAAADINEKKKAEQEKVKAANERSNNTDKVLNLYAMFSDYLGTINCVNARFDEIVTDDDIMVENVSSSDVWQTQQLFDKYKRQLKEFISYGGDPFFLHDLNKMDLYIEIMRRLKEYGWVDRQEKYLSYDDTFWLDSDWKDEQREQLKRDMRNAQISTILNVESNDLAKVLRTPDYEFVPYNEHKDAIFVNTAKYNDGKTDDFLDFLTISIVFTNEYIIIYNYETHDEIYFKSDISGKKVEMMSAPIFGDWSLVEICGLSLLFKTETAIEIESMYDIHDIEVEETIQYQYTTAYENINSLSGIEFEKVCQRLLENMGFSVETTKASGDGGIDLIAYNSQPLLSGKYIIQCKRYTGSVGEPIIRDLYGVVTSERANKGILMTSGVFTKQAQVFAEGKPIELIDGVKLKELLKDFYN